MRMGKEEEENEKEIIINQGLYSGELYLLEDIIILTNKKTLMCFSRHACLVDRVVVNDSSNTNLINESVLLRVMPCDRPLA